MLSSTNKGKQENGSQSRKALRNEIINKYSQEIGHLRHHDEEEEEEWQTAKSRSRISHKRANNNSKSLSLSNSQQGNSSGQSVSAFVRDGQVYLAKDNDDDSEDNNNMCCTWLFEKCRKCAQHGYQYLFALALIFVLASILFIDQFVEYSKDHKVNKLRDIVRNLSHGVMDTSYTCARQEAYNPTAPIPLSSSLEKAFTQIRKLHSTHQSNYDTYMKEIIHDLQQPNCTGATTLLSSLLSMFMFDQLSNDHVELNHERELIMAWAFALSQLEEESHFHLDSSTQFTSSQAIEGAAANMMCSPVMQIYWQNTFPTILDTLNCPSNYIAHVISEIQLNTNVGYHLPLNGIIYMVQATWRNKNFETSLLSEYAGILIEMGILMLVCAMSMFILTRTIWSTRQAIEERVMIEKDFYIDNRKVAVKPETLRLLDLYCWKVGNLEEVSVEDVMEFISEGYENECYRERRYNPLSYFTSPRHSQWLGPCNAGGENNTSNNNNNNNNNNNEMTGRINVGSSHMLPFAAQGSNVKWDNEKDYIHSKNNINTVNNSVNLLQGVVPFHKARSLQAEAAARRRRLRRYFKEYEKLDEATQIQIHLHRIVHPLLLLKPFVPEAMMREFVYSEFDHGHLGPALREVKKTTVLQDGLECDAVVYVFVSFRRFNTNETLTRATQHFISVDEQRQRRAEKRAEARHQTKWSAIGGNVLRRIATRHNGNNNNHNKRGNAPGVPSQWKKFMRRQRSMDNSSSNNIIPANGRSSSSHRWSLFARRKTSTINHSSSSNHNKLIHYPLLNEEDEDDYHYITRWTSTDVERAPSVSLSHPASPHMRAITSASHGKNNNNNNSLYQSATDVAVLNDDCNVNNTNNNNNNTSNNSQALYELQRPLGARLLGNTNGAVGEWKFLQRHKMINNEMKQKKQKTAALSNRFTFAKSKDNNNNINNTNTNTLTGNTSAANAPVNAERRRKLFQHDDEDDENFCNPNTKNNNNNSNNKNSYNYYRNVNNNMLVRNDDQLQRHEQQQQQEEEEEEQQEWGEYEELDEDECYGHYGEEDDISSTTSNSSDDNDNNNNIKNENSTSNKSRAETAASLRRKKRKKQIKKLQQPLSLVASGLNYIVAYTRYAARVFHGQVAQISSDGILLQFREGGDAEDEDHHCLHTREIVKNLQSNSTSSRNNNNVSSSNSINSSSSNNTQGRSEESTSPFYHNSHPSRATNMDEMFTSQFQHGSLTLSSSSSSLLPNSSTQPLRKLEGNKMTIHDKTYYLSKEERAVRAAHFIQQSLDRSLDFAENRYTPQELLHCPIMVLADNAALRGRLRFHVSRHYSVLSPCIPLFFPLEEICMEYNVGLLITEDVFECAENAIIARPFHFMDIGDLNSYYFAAQQNRERFRARRMQARLTAGFGSLSPKKEYYSTVNYTINNTNNNNNTNMINNNAPNTTGKSVNTKNVNFNPVNIGAGVELSKSTMTTTSASLINSSSGQGSSNSQSQEESARQASRSNSLKSGVNSYDGAFAMKGSLYEVLSTRRITNVSGSGESSAEGEGRNQARHDH